MRILKIFHVLFFILIVNITQSQTVVDSSLVKKFPFRLGNVGFAIDSMEFIVGEFSRGETFHYEVQMYNFGKDPILFKSGRISRLVEMNYNPGVLAPGQIGTAIIDFEVIRELPSGPTQTEIAIETDDRKQPYKFIYMLGEVVEDQNPYGEQQLIIDSVPRMVFDHYNFDFGHLPRGKTVIHTFLFTNRGSEDLIIDEINSTDGCSVIPPSMTVIPPGGDGALVVKVRMIGNYGVQHRTVNIQTNDPKNPKITLGLHGSVRQVAPSLSDPDFCYQ